MKDRYGTPIVPGSKILYPTSGSDIDGYDGMAIHTYIVERVINEHEESLWTTVNGKYVFGDIKRITCHLMARRVNEDGSLSKLSKLTRGAQAIVIDKISFNVENPINIDMRIRK